MLLKTMVYKKQDLTTVTESNTLEEALQILEDSGFRCVPILDESNKIFRGNIYKMHIYRHKANGGDMTLPVTHLLKKMRQNLFIQVLPSFKFSLPLRNFLISRFLMKTTIFMVF